MATQVERRLLTVEEYDCMVEAGMLWEDSRVELIGGELVRMAAIGRRHAGSITVLNQSLVPKLLGVAILRVQLPVAIPRHDEPEPDITIARSHPDFYRSGHPTPADVLLLIEVSDTTLAYDRGVKLRVYASAWIPEVWVVNLVEDVIERYAEPDGVRYRSVARFGRGERVTSVVLPTIGLPVDEVLG